MSSRKQAERNEKESKPGLHCGKCRRSFQTPPELSRHCRHHHGGWFPCSSSRCKYESRKLENVLRHRQKCHHRDKQESGKQVKSKQAKEAKERGDPKSNGGRGTAAEFQQPEQGHSRDNHKTKGVKDQATHSQPVNKEAAAPPEETTIALDLPEGQDMALFEELLSALEETSFPIEVDPQERVTEETHNQIAGSSSGKPSAKLKENAALTVTKGQAEVTAQYEETDFNAPVEAAESGAESSVTGTPQPTHLQHLPQPQLSKFTETTLNICEGASTSKAESSSPFPQPQGQAAPFPSTDDTPTWKLIPLDNPAFPLPDPRQLMWPTPSSDCCCRAARRVNQVKNNARRCKMVYHREQRRQAFPLSVEYGELTEEAKLPDGSHYRVSYRSYRLPPFPTTN